MLSPKLQEIKDQIEAKSSYLRTDGEKDLLGELEVLEQHLAKKFELNEFRESVKSRTQITSGPGGSCPCCGR